jgi:hypothetical protein
MKALLLCLVLLGVSSYAEADEWIVFGQTEEQGGLLTDAEILLKNRSYNRLYFYASGGQEPWTKFFIDGHDTALVRKSKVIIAISTSRSESDPEAEAPPQTTPNEAAAGARSGTPVESGVYTIAHFSGGQRAEFCYNKVRKRWMILIQGEPGC